MSKETGDGPTGDGFSLDGKGSRGKGEGYLTHGVNVGGAHDNLGNLGMPGAHGSMVHGRDIEMMDHSAPSKLHNGRGSGSR